MGIFRYNKPVKGANFTVHVFADISTDVFRTEGGLSCESQEEVGSRMGNTEQKGLAQSLINHLKATLCQALSWDLGRGTVS